jgi:hypothetical protein
MSALGHKRTLKRLETMSALPPKADIRLHECDVRYGQKQKSSSLINQLVCTSHQGRGYLNSNRLCGL